MQRCLLQVSTIVGRTNTVNGRQYKSDPTIFAWEICNECHTTCACNSACNDVMRSLGLRTQDWQRDSGLAEFTG